MKGNSTPGNCPSSIEGMQSNGASLGSLYPGSKFKGQQTSGRSSYEVTVEIKDVDVAEAALCGYLEIKGLTADYPLLTTYFEAEIIGHKHTFVTDKWEADENVDWQHWSKFASFSKHRDHFLAPVAGYDYNNQSCIYMRWKEHFLVPDHKVRTVAGASFSGFYYICYDRSTDNISGFYYSARSDWFQSLNLTHVLERSFPTFTFR